MNYHQDELTANYNRERVREVFNQIHLEHKMANLSTHRPSLFTMTMHSFAVWMISTGKELNERYEIPSNSFAR
jgi:hypothetical protein